MNPSNPVIYHNPRCSKSRETLKLLQDRNLSPQIIEYLVTPPTREELQQILSMLGITPRELLRNTETAFREAGLDDESLSDEELISAMIAQPILIQRPIVVSGNSAAIGRPPSAVLEIIA